MKNKVKRYIVRLEQEGQVVVEVDASTREEAEREIQHYIMMYAQDGKVKIKWKKQR